MMFLSNKEKKFLLSKISFEFSKKDDLKKDKNGVIFLNKDKILIEIEKNFFIPHLNSFNEKVFLEENFKKVLIDDGAIKFILKGANIAKPGIEFFSEDIKNNEIIIVKNKNFPKILAIAKAKFSSEEIKQKESGIVFENLHFVKDFRY